MKKQLAFCLAFLLALSLLGCNRPVDRVLDPPASEKSLQSLQETSVIEDIRPVLEEMPWLISEGYTALEEIPDYEYSSLVFYFVEGKRGIASWDGVIRIDAEYDVRWCDLHGFCNSEYGIMFDGDFSSSDHYGHGSLLGNYYYDPELHCLIGGNEGPSVQLSPDDYSFQQMAELGRLPGVFETGSFYIPDENYPGEGAVKPLGKYVVLDEEGNPLTVPNLEEAKGFLNGICLVKEGGKWRFLDIKGNPVLDGSYDGAGHFSEGLAPVSKNGMWGYVRPDGSTALGFRYEEARPVRDGTAWVKREGKWQLVELFA